jgi:hypothetical protein
MLLDAVYSLASGLRGVERISIEVHAELRLIGPYLGKEGTGGEGGKGE